MQRCPKCAQAFEGGKCPACGEDAPGSLATKLEINKSLSYFMMTDLGGLFGILVAAHFYPPLDTGAVMGVALVLFFIPTAMILAVRKNPAAHAERVRKTCAWSAIALVSFAIFLFLNGNLDRNPPVQIQTTLIRKSVARGRGGPNYSLIVAPSWRQGRRDEELNVSGATFSKVRIGESVLVVVHRGLLGLPWFSNVLPD
jgi:hypothetical protein